MTLLTDEYFIVYLPRINVILFFFASTLNIFSIDSSSLETKMKYFVETTALVNKLLYSKIYFRSSN